MSGEAELAIQTAEFDMAGDDSGLSRLAGPAKRYKILQGKKGRANLG
jgi:hypothetical protein